MAKYSQRGEGKKEKGRGLLTILQRMLYRNDMVQGEYSFPSLNLSSAYMKCSISVEISIPGAHLGGKWRRRKLRDLGPEKGGKQTAKLEGRFCGEALGEIKEVEW